MVELTELLELEVDDALDEFDATKLLASNFPQSSSMVVLQFACAVAFPVAFAAQLSQTW